MKQGESQRAIFLDRDGVINRTVMRSGKPYPPDSLSDVEILPGVQSGLAELRALGYLLIVVTNQPDVARGKQTRENVEEIHHFLQNSLPIMRFMVCYHDDQDQCTCRKPLPGLLLDAASQENIDLSQSFMIGDRWRDIEAGQRANCKTIFMDYGYDEQQPQSTDFRVSSFAEAVEIIKKNGNSQE